jgi:hypothetical protein
MLLAMQFVFTASLSHVRAGHLLHAQSEALSTGNRKSHPDRVGDGSGGAGSVVGDILPPAARGLTTAVEFQQDGDGSVETVERELDGVDLLPLTQIVAQWPVPFPKNDAWTSSVLHPFLYRLQRSKLFLSATHFFEGVLAGLRPSVVPLLAEADGEGGSDTGTQLQHTD